jgi:hypothetical protein
LIFASLYQDKEGRKKVNTNEGEAYKDSVLELLDIYRDDKKVSVIPTTSCHFELQREIFRFTPGDDGRLTSGKQRLIF